MKILKMRLPAGLSSIIAFGIILAIVLFIMGGGIYILVTNVPFNSPTGSGLASSSLSDQYGIETLLSVAFMFIGFLGFLVVYESTKHVYNASYATKLLVLGVFMIIVSTLLLYWLLIPKTTFLFPWARNSGL